MVSGSSGRDFEGQVEQFRAYFNETEAQVEWDSDTTMFSEQLLLSTLRWLRINIDPVAPPQLSGSEQTCAPPFFPSPKLPVDLPSSMRYRTSSIPSSAARTS